MKRGLMDPSFKYVKSGETDLKKTFARIRRQLAETDAIKAEPKVRPIKSAKKGAA